MIDRDAFTADLPALLARADAPGAAPLSFARVEVDPPAGGDAIADVIAASVRGIDLVVRWSERGYLVVLGSSGLAGAISFAERLRETIAAAGAATISAGVAEHVPLEPFAEVLGRADEALAVARAEGRNQVRP